MGTVASQQHTFEGSTEIYKARDHATPVPLFYQQKECTVQIDPEHSPRHRLSTTVWLGDGDNNGKNDTPGYIESALYAKKAKWNASVTAIPLHQLIVQTK